MFKRIISLTLSVLLLMSMAMAESGVTAADALFGDAAMGVQDAAIDPVDEGEAAAYDGGGEDIYGANDTASASAYPTIQLGDSDSTDGLSSAISGVASSIGSTISSMGRIWAIWLPSAAIAAIAAVTCP